MRINKAGIDLIKEFEGLRLEAYKCPSKIWTQGYGQTGAKVRPGTSISQATAEHWLAEDLQKFEQAVQRLVKVPLNENQFSALVSFAYNCGANALANSTALKRLNAGDYEGCVEALQYWVKGASNQVLPGLVRRRRAEGELFSLAPTPAVPTNTTPIMKSSPQNLPNSFLLNSYRYFKDLPHQKEAIAYLEQHVPAYALLEMQRIWRTEAEDLGLPKISEQLPENGVNPVISEQPKEAKAAPVKPKSLVERIVAYYQLNDWKLFDKPGELNICYLKDADESGKPYPMKPNHFDDRRILFTKRSDGWAIIFNGTATVDPSRHWTLNPMNPGGAAQIKLDTQFTAWQFGTHGSGRNAHLSLIQVKPITVIRDRNKSMSRDEGDKEDTGLWGINQHSGWDAPIENINRHSAGCCVGRHHASHIKFMNILKTDPRYRANKNFIFSTAVIDTQKMHEQ